MATPRVKADDQAPARRGPRRALAAVRAAVGLEPDLDRLRADLLATIARHYPQADPAPVNAALDLATAAHEGQRRASGEAYVTHPIASAQILADLGIDPVAVQ